MGNLIREKQDLTFLQWSRVRHSSGTAGSFLKSQSELGGEKKYYKLSNYDPEKGVVGHECVNEFIVDRLLTVLGVEHLSYELIHADIDVDGRKETTYLAASLDFKNRGESKTTLENYYIANASEGGSRYDFCVRNGWQKYIDTMIAVDYLILNRDRHGANIEVLRNARAKTLRIAPLFDHGLSLLFSCRNEKDIAAFDMMEDRPCNNFIGGRSCYENLRLIAGKGDIFPYKLSDDDRIKIIGGLEEIIPTELADNIWEMIMKRYQVYEEFCNIG